MLRQELTAQAETLQQLLVNVELQQRLKGRTLVVDEAGLISTRQMHDLCIVAQQQDCRVLLVGDIKQHASVEAGDALRALQRFAQVDEEFPGTVTLHLILDNYDTHGHERVRARLARYPRFVLHFIPTSSSWLNLIERWFAELSQKTVRRGVFRSVAELEQAIADFLAAWNTSPIPFVWTASVEKVLAKIARARHRLEEIQPGSSIPPNRKK